MCLCVARGQFKGHLPPACNMNELKYSITLERIAMKWSKSNNCYPSHNFKAHFDLLESYNTFGANRFDLPWDPNDVNVPPNNIDVGENIKVAATSGV